MECRRKVQIVYNSADNIVLNPLPSTPITPTTLHLPPCMHTDQRFWEWMLPMMLAYISIDDRFRGLQKFTKAVEYYDNLEKVSLGTCMGLGDENLWRGVGTNS